MLNIFVNVPCVFKACACICDNCENKKSESPKGMKYFNIIVHVKQQEIIDKMRT